MQEYARALAKCPRLQKWTKDSRASGVDIAIKAEKAPQPLALKRAMGRNRGLQEIDEVGGLRRRCFAFEKYARTRSGDGVMPSKIACVRF